MFNIKLPKPVVIVLRIIEILVMLDIVAVIILYMSGGFSIYPNNINAKNIDKFIGDDLWSEFIGKFDYAEISNLPVKGQLGKISDYDATINLVADDKNDWINKANEMAEYISQHLIDNPECELNSFDSVSIRIREYDSVKFVEYSDVYQMGGNHIELEGLSCIRVSSNDASFLDFSDLSNFYVAEYLIVDVPIDNTTDFSILRNFRALVVMDLFIDNDKESMVEEKINALDLPYKINIL